jgi:uncharacterized NAD(P)/FAD-binding protein YdhS
MSIFSDDSEHFYQWLKLQNFTYDATDFVPRKIFGDYLKFNYDWWVQNRPQNIQIQKHFIEVIDIKKLENQFEVHTTEKVFSSDIVVLAFGNLTSSQVSHPQLASFSNYIRSPWADGALNKIDPTHQVLLIGSGLTAQDVILSLEGTNKIWSVSRRGFLPMPHKKFEPYPNFWEQLEGKNLIQIFNIVKSHLKSHHEPRALTAKNLIFF